MAVKKISNSLSRHFFITSIVVFCLLIMAASMYSEAKPLALAALFALVIIIVNNDKIFLDLTQKDGFNISGTIVKAYINIATSAFSKTS